MNWEDDMAGVGKARGRVAGGFGRRKSTSIGQEWETVLGAGSSLNSGARQRWKGQFVRERTEGDIITITARLMGGAKELICCLHSWFWFSPGARGPGGAWCDAGRRNSSSLPPSCQLLHVIKHIH